MISTRRQAPRRGGSRRRQMTKIGSALENYNEKIITLSIASPPDELAVKNAFSGAHAQHAQPHVSHVWITSGFTRLRSKIGSALENYNEKIITFSTTNLR
jgi:hypothetical protein